MEPGDLVSSYTATHFPCRNLATTHVHKIPSGTLGILLSTRTDEYGSRRALIFIRESVHEIYADLLEPAR
jgi:hypothetical protein